MKFAEEREEEREEAARMEQVLGWTQMQLGLSQEALEEAQTEKAEVTVAKTDTEEKLRKSAAKVTFCCFRSLACNSKYRVRFFLLGPPLFVEV